MNNPLRISFDSSSDIYEIGLMAADGGADADGSAGAAKETRPIQTRVMA
jgi:hypothetical protein